MFVGSLQARLHPYGFWGDNFYDSPIKKKENVGGIHTLLLSETVRKVGKTSWKISFPWPCILIGVSALWSLPYHSETDPKTKKMRWCYYGVSKYIRTQTLLLGFPVLQILPLSLSGNNPQAMHIMLRFFQESKTPFCFQKEFSRGKGSNAIRGTWRVPAVVAAERASISSLAKGPFWYLKSFSSIPTGPAAKGPRGGESGRQQWEQEENCFEVNWWNNALVVWIPASPKHRTQDEGHKTREKTRGWGGVNQQANHGANPRHQSAKIKDNRRRDLNKNTNSKNGLG